MATGKLIRALAQRTYSISRPAAAPRANPEGAADQNADSASKDEVGNSQGTENRASKGVKKAKNIEPDLNSRVYRESLSAREITDADEIGYSIIGPAKTGEFPRKPKLPIYAVVQVGAHQFKVSSGDRIVVEKLKYADVNQKILLNKVLMLGTQSQTIIGRPMLPTAAVCALVEEQGLGATVIIFKKKRRKNYRRTNFHRQELTTLRIMDIHGLDKSLLEATYAE
ncbi:hypothetical protein SUGI_0594110 [Cryptomeria japonica]|nr:hypothetical protein SUGI_0594110 [Cryptomeria japonica]